MFLKVHAAYDLSRRSDVFLLSPWVVIVWKFSLFLRWNYALLSEHHLMDTLDANLVSSKILVTKEEKND
jgi:hypothetical protein